MLVSIIIPTLNRKDSLINLLESLINQTYKDIEMIIVDQNDYGFLDEIVKNYSRYLKILHLLISTKGASAARNIGSLKANGSIICFPDDDCEFFKNTIEIAVEFFKNNNAILVSGKTVDRNGNDSVLNYSLNSSDITIRNYYNKFVEATIFVLRDKFLLYKFDENLGVGKFFGAEEGRDLVYRMLLNNENLYFNNNIILFHPQKIVDKLNKEELFRVFKYRCGYAAFCKKHKKIFEFSKRLIMVFLYFLFLFFSFNKKYRYYMIEFLALILGWLIY